MADADSVAPERLFEGAPAPRTVVIAVDAGSRATAGLERELRHVLKCVRAVRSDGLDTSIGLGASLLRDSARSPRQLTLMPVFAGDVLDPGRSHGDLLIQVAGPDRSGVGAAVERVLKELSGWRVRWRIEGLRAENRVEDGRGLARNPFHFTEGFGNPDDVRGVRDRALVRADQGEPEWAVGGSYQVVRIIQLATELWDKDSVHEQERIIGRRRDGRWLDGTPQGEQPNFDADPRGKLTPLDSHVRLAAPDRRNPPPVVRRGYNYDRGDGDTGLIFSCFQRDLARGFEAVQKRLEGEAMATYMLTVGGGYFFIPPPGDTWVDALFQP
ncbi:Dyp-type peroxidase (plasmid) [Streptomyces laculatispora]|uniref:Dyp-type peroxidase n=1 Tax=Streptomyces laculatispora TaxID=887464 RepID=A0ABY9IGT4_9ACTN|nr:Dyp-type peroxidase [Streptomyces laculatispora]WLQ45626.1 Dyp-type peroxidase [Streptomyces laculatispora]